MMPCTGSQRPDRPDPTCRETGQHVHQNGDACARRRRGGISPIDVKSFHNNMLQIRTGRGRRARIVHPLHLRARGCRETGHITIEEL